MSLQSWFRSQVCVLLAKWNSKSGLRKPSNPLPLTNSPGNGWIPSDLRNFSPRWPKASSFPLTRQRNSVAGRSAINLAAKRRPINPDAPEMTIMILLNVWSPHSRSNDIPPFTSSAFDARRFPPRVEPREMVGIIPAKRLLFTQPILIGCRSQLCSLTAWLAHVLGKLKINFHRWGHLLQVSGGVPRFCPLLRQRRPVEERYCCQKACK